MVKFTFTTCIYTSHVTHFYGPLCSNEPMAQTYDTERNKLNTGRGNIQADMVIRSKSQQQNRQRSGLTSAHDSSPQGWAKIFIKGYIPPLWIA